MRVGTVCYAHSRGLGHLARDFHRHGIITDVCVVKHPSIPMNEEWYPNALVLQLRNLDKRKMQEFCREMDAVIFFETPFDYDIINYCHGHRIRSYIVTMYECTPTNHSQYPVHKYLCPSLLDVDYFQKWNYQYLPLPVDYPWKLRTHANHFIHNGGYLGLKGSDGVQREGTTTLIDAMQWVQSDIRLTIRVQENVSASHIDRCKADQRITYVPETIPYTSLYSTGDVAIGAQKWNGCSLPLQEAFASGMLIINTDRYPMNTWLPQAPLVKPCRTVYHRIGGPYYPFQESIIDPKELARKIDEWAGKDITEYSMMGKKYAEEHSWERLGPLWKKALES